MIFVEDGWVAYERERFECGNPRLGSYDEKPHSLYDMTPLTTTTTNIRTYQNHEHTTPTNPKTVNRQLSRNSSDDYRNGRPDAGHTNGGPHQYSTPAVDLMCKHLVTLNEDGDRW